jgi:hypothetical protein
MKENEMNDTCGMHGELKNHASNWSENLLETFHFDFYEHNRHTTPTSLEAQTKLISMIFSNARKVI